MEFHDKLPPEWRVVMSEFGEEPRIIYNYFVLGISLEVARRNLLVSRRNLHTKIFAGVQPYLKEL